MRARVRGTRAQGHTVDCLQDEAAASRHVSLLLLASAVLDVAAKDLQNFVQAGVLRPRRQGNRRYFDRKQLLSAKVAFFLKDSLGTSARYLSRFTRAVSAVPGFASGAAKAVRLESGPHGLPGHYHD